MKRKNKPTGHGGRRRGAGRKPAGTEAYLIRMKPATMRRLKAAADSQDLTPGEYLDTFEAFDHGPEAVEKT